MNLNRNRIIDGGRAKFPRQRITRVEVERDGRRVIEERMERLPAMVTVKMLNPAGTTIDLDLGNANAQAEDGKTPYYDQRLRKKLSHGWIPWGRCPAAMVASGELSPRAIKKESIRTDAPCIGGGFGPANPCPHALAEQAHRAELHGQRMAAREEANKAEFERDREQRERHHEELLKAQQEQNRALQAALEAVAGSGKQQQARKRGDGEG